MLRPDLIDWIQLHGSTMIASRAKFRPKPFRSKRAFLLLGTLKNPRELLCPFHEIQNLVAFRDFFLKDSSVPRSEDSTSTRDRCRFSRAVAVGPNYWSFGSGFRVSVANTRTKLEWVKRPGPGRGEGDILDGRGAKGRKEGRKACFSPPFSPRPSSPSRRFRLEFFFFSFSFLEIGVFFKKTCTRCIRP